MKILGSISVFILVAILLADKPADYSKQFIKEVDRVMMTKPGDYSIFVPHGTELVREHYSRGHGCYKEPEPRVFKDVPSGFSMWVKLERRHVIKRWWDDVDCTVIREIHIKDPSQIEGGSWSDRSSRRTRDYQTIPVQ